MKQEWECDKCNNNGVIEYFTQGTASVYEILGNFRTAHSSVSPNCDNPHSNLYAPPKNIADTDTFSKFTQILNQRSSELCPQ